jgi:hypothetical protein
MSEDQPTLRDRAEERLQGLTSTGGIGVYDADDMLRDIAGLLSTLAVERAARERAEDCTEWYVQSALKHQETASAHYARVRELTQSRDNAIANQQRWLEAAETEHAARLEAEAEAAGLRKALEPFARFARAHIQRVEAAGEAVRDDMIVLRMNDVPLVLGDLRQAAEVWKP